MTEMLKKVKAGLRSTIGWARDHRLRVAALVLVFLMALPRPVKSQFLDPCCVIMAAGLSTISSTLSSVIGGGLNSVLSVDRTISNFEQGVVWPQRLISQAQALVGTLRGVSTQIRSVMSLPVASATLPASQQLEQNLLSANAGQIPNTGSAYTGVYGQLPAVTQASPQSRNLMDMTDAIAQDAMKRAIEIDNLANLEIQAANQINQSIQTAAPGSAPILEAEADAWLVRANAYTQAATADLIRVRAAALADRSADLKLGASNTQGLDQKLQNMLQPKQ
jgi:hypothetical protein